MAVCWEQGWAADDTTDGDEGGTAGPGLLAVQEGSAQTLIWADLLLESLDLPGAGETWRSGRQAAGISVSGSPVAREL